MPDLYGTLTLDRHGLGYALAADEEDYRNHFVDSDPDEVGAGTLEVEAVANCLASYGEPPYGNPQWTTAKAQAILRELDPDVGED